MKLRPLLIAAVAACLSAACGSGGGSAAKPAATLAPEVTAEATGTFAGAGARMSVAADGKVTLSAGTTSLTATATMRGADGLVLKAADGAEEVLRLVELDGKKAYEDDWGNLLVIER